MKRKRNIYRVMKRMTKNFWKNWKMAADMRYHRVTNVKRGMRNARRLFLAMLCGLWSVLMTAVSGLPAATFVLAVCLCFAGCRTTVSTQREHRTHVVNADTIARQAAHDRQSHREQENIDSIVTARMWAVMEEYASQEQAHERTTETLTETIDSLGRIVRQQQTTTDRTLSRREQQRTEQQIQQIETDFRRQMSRLDSTWRSRFNEYQAHLRDSMTADLEKQKTTEPVASPGSLWSDIKRIFFLLALLWGIILIIRYKDKLPNSH